MALKKRYRIYWPFIGTHSYTHFLVEIINGFEQDTAYYFRHNGSIKTNHNSW